MKKSLLALLILLVVIGLGVGIFLFTRSKKVDEKEPLMPVETFVTTAVEDRPFVSLFPSEDGHWLTLKVEGIKNADSLEYELVYDTADGMSQGAVGGPFSLSGETGYEKKILLGTQSSGHYRYHEGVENGSLMIRLDGGPGPRKFTSEFKLQLGSEELVSPDGVLTVEGDFPAKTYFVALSTVGFPVGALAEGETFYGLFAAAKLSKKVTLSAAGINGSPAVYWDGEDWSDASGAGFTGEMVFAAGQSPVSPTSD